MVAAPLALAAPANAAPQTKQVGEYTVTALKFTVQAGGRSCAVDADLYRPAGVDAAHTAPAVLATNGFGGSKSDGSTDAIGKAFAARGYVGLVYSGLGFGKSGCLVSLDDPRDRRRRGLRTRRLPRRDPRGRRRHEGRLRHRRTAGATPVSA